MTLIEEIQQEAVDSRSDLGAVFRKCKILAARLGSRPLEDWLLWESNGYPEEVEFPDYRIWPLQLKGHFSGPFGSGLRNAPIPWMCLPEKARKPYQNYKCRQSIASIEEILRKSKSGSLHVSTGDLAVILGMNVYEGQNCMQAWAEFSISNLVELLNTVRNRVLDFALAIWKESSTAGELSKQSGQVIEPGRINHIFNTTVYGGAANLVGNASNSPITITVSQGDFSALEKVLCSNGVQEEDIRDLQSAVRADEQPKTAQALGPRVSNWIAGMMKKAAQGTWQIGIGAAGKLLAEAISKYYGL
jgi:hypothetical protein